jgi:hypothetical protein
MHLEPREGDVVRAQADERARCASDRELDGSRPVGSVEPECESPKLLADEPIGHVVAGDVEIDAAIVVRRGAHDGAVRIGRGRRSLNLHDLFGQSAAVAGALEVAHRVAPLARGALQRPSAGAAGGCSGRAAAVAWRSARSDEHGDGENEFAHLGDVALARFGSPDERLRSGAVS